MIRDAGCGMRDAGHAISANTLPRALSIWRLFGGTMSGFDGGDEAVQFRTEFVQSSMDVIEERVVGKRTCLKKLFEVVDGFVAGAVGVSEVFDELQFVASATITLDDVASDRLRRASDLRRGFKLLKLRELHQRHTMNVDCNVTSQLPDLQISVTHARHDTGFRMRDARCDFPAESARKRPSARKRRSTKPVLPTKREAASFLNQRAAHPASRIPYPASRP